MLGQLGGGLCFARRKVYAKTADPLLWTNFETIERDEKAWAAVKSLTYTHIPAAHTNTGESAMYNMRMLDIFDIHNGSRATNADKHG